MTSDGSVQGCTRCGECCTFLLLDLNGNLDLDVLSWLEHHGVTQVIRMNRRFLRIPLKCRMLSQTGECKIYEARPDICRRGQCLKTKPNL